MSNTLQPVRDDFQQPGAHDAGFFTHHRIWAPGVRAFRALRFAAKATIRARRAAASPSSPARCACWRSAEAAREIETLIGRSARQVEIGTGIVRKAGATIDDIVLASQRVNQLLGEVATGARERDQAGALAGEVARFRMPEPGPTGRGQPLAARRPRQLPG